MVKEYSAGDVFGELALLYNAPRAATIIAETEGVLWSLDRECFNHIVKDAAVKRRERYVEFLCKVELLAGMDPYERSQLADVLKTEKFAQGDVVIKQGEEGNVFFIVEDGSAVATKVLHEGQQAQEVMRYGPGDYFGELALIRNEPRAANVQATSELKCLTLDRHSFKRLLGRLEDILRRNAKNYEVIVANKIG
jgi:cAMP-dependent protein kinase regulator